MVMMTYSFEDAIKDMKAHRERERKENVIVMLGADNVALCLEVGKKAEEQVMSLKNSIARVRLWVKNYREGRSADMDIVEEIVKES